MRARAKTDSPAAEIEVDFTELDHLVSALRALAAELSRTGSLSSHVDDPDLADDLARVELNWHKQRVALQTFLDSVVASVAVSLTAYRQLERELTKVAATGQD